MKFYSPTLAILALCSAAGAAPISTMGDFRDSFPREAALLGHDLSFNEDAVEQSLPQEPESAQVATGVDSDVALSAEELASRNTELSWIPASEPPPVADIALALTFLGIAGIVKRTRTERRRLRRQRVVRMRAIIAAR